jgi:hypothetical protein
MSTIGIYGGGFKPPTKGHFTVAYDACKKHPEMDLLRIYVGGKERDGIDQETSLKIWNIYKKYIPIANVEILPTKRGPIGEIASYAKRNPNDKVIFVIGAREGSQEDLDDLKSRTTPMLQKYDNLEVALVTTKDKAVSGTNARKAIKVSKDALEPFLPEQLRPDEVEQVFNLLTPIVKEEILAEGRYDAESLKLSRQIVSLLKANKGKSFTKVLEGDFEGIWYDLRLKFKTTDEYPFMIDGSASRHKIMIEITYNPDEIKENFNEFIVELKDVLRHEFEHFGQFNFYKDAYPTTSGDDLSMFDYLKLDHEIPAQVQGLYKRSKVSKKSFTEVLDTFLDLWSDKLSSKEAKKIKKLYIKYAKENLPKVQLKENATYTKHIDLIQQLAEFTEYLLKEGHNIEPLPNIEFEEGNVDNASDFFGMTAFYDPDSQTIVLFTEGRHPKDIVRSYSHEMVHHTQQLEGRLGGIKTTNTTEDSNLGDIEEEAYLKGNISFRNYTDSLNESKKDKDYFGLNAFSRELAVNLDEKKTLTNKLKDASKDQIKDFKNLSPLLKQWKNKTITDSGKKKLKVLLVDIAKSLGIALTSITINAMLSILINKLSKGKYSGTLPSKLKSVLRESLLDE